MKQRWNWTVLAVAVLCVPALAFAGDKKGGGQNQPVGHKSLVWLVDSVSSNSVILAKNDHSETTNLTITASTQIFVNGPLGKLSNAQVGMRAEFSATDANVTRLAFFDYTPPVEKPYIAEKPHNAVKVGRNKKNK